MQRLQQPANLHVPAAGWDPALLAKSAAIKDTIASLDGLMASDELKEHLRQALCPVTHYAPVLPKCSKLTYMRLSSCWV